MLRPMGERTQLIRAGLKLLLVATMLLVAACAPTVAVPSQADPTQVGPIGLTKNADGYVALTGDQLAEMLQHKNFTLVNVHVPYDGEIALTDAFIVFDQIDQHLDELPAKDAPIVLDCSSGRMSTIAAQTLTKPGYTNVFELDGGFTAWRTAGRAVIRQAR